MAKADCYVCAKTQHTGHAVSHSNRKTLRKWKPNLQTVKIKTANGRIMTIKVCSRCIKSNLIRKA